MKLDQQFASTHLGRGTQAPLAAECRWKMIEDVIAVLPSIERQEIEEKLRAVGQQKPRALAKTAQNKTAAVDLDMSWEEILLPPSRALPTTSGAPRFILERPTYGHNQPRAAAVPTIEGPPVQRVGPSLALAPPRASDGVVPPSLNGAIALGFASDGFAPFKKPKLTAWILLIFTSRELMAAACAIANSLRRVVLS